MKFKWKNLPKEVLLLSDLFQKNHYDLYLVGGCVRDHLLNPNDAPHDWDMCTNARPDEMLEMFRKEGYAINPAGIKFGTVSVLLNGTEYEITTFRKDGSYADGRHPDAVDFCTSIEEDLSRRDFTINAMAYNLFTGELIDPFHGEADLKNHLIRTVNNPDDRFEEDSLRIVRALRFSIRYQFQIEEQTKRSMQNQVRLLELRQNVSKERITAELKKILTCGMPIFDAFVELHEVVFKMIPELRPCYKFWQNNKYHMHDVYEHILSVVDACDTNDFVIKLAALYHDIGKPDAYSVDDEGHGHFYGHPEVSYEIFLRSAKENLRLTKDEYERCALLVRKHDMELSASERCAHRLIVNYGIDFVRDFLVLKRADISDHIFPEQKKPNWFYVDDFERAVESVLEKESVFGLKDLDVNGKDLMKELNMKPGKEIGALLQALLDAVLEEKVSNDKESLLKFAKTLS